MNDDAIWQRDEVESPCRKICVIHPAAEICIGCFRTRHEIAGWSRMSSAERQALMAALPEREPQLTKGRRGGRRGRRTESE